MIPEIVCYIYLTSVQNLKQDISLIMTSILFSRQLWQVLYFSRQLWNQDFLLGMKPFVTKFYEDWKEFKKYISASCAFPTNDIKDKTRRQWKWKRIKGS